MDCENCGLPAWAVSGPGVKLTIEAKPENRFQQNQRARKRTVWCHNEECAIQTLAVSKYGPASHKWPITLAQFRAMNRDVIRRAACYEIPSQDADSRDPKNALNEKVSLPRTERLLGEFRNAGGRPRRFNSNAARQREYRNRLKSAPAAKSLA